MAETSGKLRKSKPIDFNIRVLHMRVVQRYLNEGKYVDGIQLAAALRQEAGKPIPSDVLDYLCRFLEGKVKKPKGRKPLPKTTKNLRRQFLAYEYHRRLKWLKKREKSGDGLKGCPGIQNASWWVGPPHERAARMVAHRGYFGIRHWETVHNIVSSHK